MLCKRGQSRHAVPVRPSVCLSRSCILSKWINLSSIFFYHRVAKPFQFFPHQTASQYSDANPLTGVLNAGGINKNRDSEPISGFTACCQPVTGQVLSTRRRRTTIPQVVTLIAGTGSKRHSLLMTGDDDEMFMTRSLNVMPKTQNSAFNVTQWQICSLRN